MLPDCCYAGQGEPALPPDHRCPANPDLPQGPMPAVNIFELQAQFHQPVCQHVDTWRDARWCVQEQASPPSGSYHNSCGFKIAVSKPTWTSILDHLAPHKTYCNDVPMAPKPAALPCTWTSPLWQPCRSRSQLAGVSPQQAWCRRPLTCSAPLGAAAVPMRGPASTPSRSSSSARASTSFCSQASGPNMRAPLGAIGPSPQPPALAGVGMSPARAAAGCAWLGRCTGRAGTRPACTATASSLKSSLTAPHCAWHHLTARAGCVLQGWCFRQLQLAESANCSRQDHPCQYLAVPG